MTDERESRPAGYRAASNPLVGDCDQDSRPVRQSSGAALLAQMRRRNEAARRLPPLEHSRRRDPLTPRERAGGGRDHDR
jgi:hypothetical protein